jgi:probable phosphoglycerate mutase
MAVERVSLQADHGRPVCGTEFTTVLLVRHGHVPGIDPATFRGRTDIELTERGVQEARRTAEWIAKRWRTTIVYTSPRRRCIDTGDAIAKHSAVSARVLPCLDDLDYGDWQSKTHDAVAAESPTMYRRWWEAPQSMRFPNGESLQNLLARAADAVRVARDEHPAQTIVMVSHDSLNRAILVHILDQPASAYWTLAQDPCAINEIRIMQGRAVLMHMNQVAHLECP